MRRDGEGRINNCGAGVAVAFSDSEERCAEEGGAELRGGQARSRSRVAARRKGRTAEGVPGKPGWGEGQGNKWHRTAEGDKCSLSSAEGVKSVS